MAHARPVAVVLVLAMPVLIAQAPPVDSKTCTTCHREIAENYARTGMAQSFFAPATSNTVEDYRKTPEYYHALSDSHYSMTVRNGQYFQRRWQLDPRGNQINVEDLKIDYVMGSGNHARHVDRASSRLVSR
jgi:hypothetical protein